MKIEHTALQVPDPVAFARWYVQHLGLRVKRAQAEPPFGQFLADDGDGVMLEVYQNPLVSTPEYRALDPLVLHVAFLADDVDATRARLLAAGATAEGPARTTEQGDRIAMLRDPWGLAIQFIQRADPMLR